LEQLSSSIGWRTSAKSLATAGLKGCTKINFSDKVFTSITVTIAKDMDRLCLNVQCSLISTTWATPYFYYFFDDKIFVTVDKKAGIFTKHIWQTYWSRRFFGDSCDG